MFEKILSKIATKNGMGVFAIVSILLTLFTMVLFTNVFNSFSARTLSDYETSQEQVIETRVSFLDEMYGKFIANARMTDEAKKSAFESILLSISKNLTVLPASRSYLLDPNLNVLLQTGTDDVQDMIDVCRPKRSDVDDGRCIVVTNGDPIHLYWHRIPRQNGEAFGDHYYLVFGFSENEALKPLQKYSDLQSIILVVGSSIVVLSAYVALWAVKTTHIIDRKQTQEEA